MNQTKMKFNKTLLVAGLSALFTFGLVGCSDDKSEPMSSNSGEGVSAPSASQPSAADVKQPASVIAPVAEEVTAVKETVTEVVKEVETQVEEKVEEVMAAVSAPAVKSGESLYASCVGCHGAAGEGGVGPKLQGQPQADIAAKLTQYKSGEQVGPMTAMMAPMTQGLSAADIDVVAEYIATF